MNKEELLYKYIYDEYVEQKQRKQEIRNRSSFFFGLGFPIIISFSIASIQSVENISLNQGLFLIFTGVFIIVSFVFFSLIYLPSDQLTYYPSQMIEEMESLESIEENIQFIDTKITNVEKEEARVYLATRLFCNTYAALYKLYEKTNKKFKVFFSILAISLCLSLLSVAISYIF